MTSHLQKIKALIISVDTKQDTLTPGDNISIVNNVISSEVSQEDLDLKQDQLTAADNITISGYLLQSSKPRFRIYRNTFTIPTGATSLLNGGTIQFQNNVTLTNGVFIANVAGVYCVTCKLRLPDNNNQTPEIQWYLRSTGGVQTIYEAFEMWICAGAGVSYLRRAGMSQCLVTLSVGQGILPRNDWDVISNCLATFEGFLVQ
jgi:hypothetical protein